MPSSARPAGYRGSVSMPQPIAFDARPLTDPVDPAAVSAFIREAKAARSGSIGAAIVLWVLVAIVLAIFIPVLAFTLVGLARTGAGVGMVPAVIFAVMGGGIAIWSIVRYRRDRVARYRISNFAAANHMTYVDRVDDPPLPGMIFGIGKSRRSDRIVRGHSPRFVEFGNYQYTVKSGKSSNTFRWGYIAVKLDVPLPNIVLDALGNNGFGTNLPRSFGKNQRLSLEGDFDRYFTLYCPQGYEQDALYLFTPDIMARFIDTAAELDVEIVDDWLFLYTKRQTSSLDPATWAWLFSAVGALITRFDQWARWRDDRLLAERAHASAQTAGFAQAPAAGQPAALPFAAPAGMLTPPGVAPQGRRLKRSVNWVVIIMAIVIGGGWFLSMIAGVFAR